MYSERGRYVINIFIFMYVLFFLWYFHAHASTDNLDSTTNSTFHAGAV